MLMRVGFVAVLLLSVARVDTSAQTAGDLVGRGISSYNALEFDDAAGFLLRALGPAMRLQLDSATTARALTYLAATETFRAREDSAASAFRRLLLLDARYRPDELVFPPEVTNLYADVRRNTKAVTIVVPSESEHAVGQVQVPIDIFATSFHEIVVRIVRLDGDPVRQLYGGPVGDSLRLQWDGRDAANNPVEGDHRLTVASNDPDGRLLRIVNLPLQIEITQPPPLEEPAPPPDSVLLPERTDGRIGLEALLGGVVGGVALAIAPAVMAPDADLRGQRFVVAGTVGIAGLVGFVVGRPGRVIPANIQANGARMEAWRTAVDSVTVENARRRRSARVAVRVGPPSIIEAETERLQ